MDEEEITIQRYLETFCCRWHPQSRLFEAIGARILEMGDKRVYTLLRNPPYLEDYTAFLEEYISEMRNLQGEVRKNVAGLELMLTEAEGSDPSHLFETNRASVLNEFENWGLDYMSLQRFANTGHLWVSVKKARFSSNTPSAAHSLLEEIKRLQEGINSRYTPLMVFERYLYQFPGYRYNRILDILTTEENNLLELRKEEYERINRIRRMFDADAYFVRKGVLCPSFVNSLVFRLEQSLDLSQNHPGG